MDIDTHRISPLEETLLALFRAGDPGSASKAREAENVRIVSALFGSVLAEEYDAFVSLIHADAEIVIHAPQAMPWIRYANGPDEAVRLVRHNFAALSEQDPELTSVVAQGDTVVVFGRERGRLRETGEPYDARYVYEFVIRNGQLARLCQVSSSL